MRKLRNLDALQKTLINAKYTCHKLQMELEDRQDWYNEKSYYWQRTPQGQKAKTILTKLQKLVDGVEAIELIGFRFRIYRGMIILYQHDID